MAKQVVSVPVPDAPGASSWVLSPLTKVTALAVDGAGPGDRLSIAGSDNNTDSPSLPNKFLQTFTGGDPQGPASSLPATSYVAVIRLPAPGGLSPHTGLVLTVTGDDGAGASGSTTVTNDGSFAKETGGNLASLVSSFATLLADVATSAAQATGNASLATVATKVTAIAAQLPALLGAQAPESSMSVTGSLATSQSEQVDVTVTGSAAAFSSLAAGPSGIRVQNTSASGQSNIRVGGSPTASQGVQLAPGAWEVFTVDNANRLKVIYESNTGAVKAGVSQA